jgi:hypothetical protein
MGLLKSMLHYAQVAWGIVSSPVGDISAALRAIWHFTGSVHTLLAELFATVSRLLHWRHVTLSTLILVAVGNILGAVIRIKAWIWHHQVNPVRLALIKRINRDHLWTAHNFFLLRQYDVRLFFGALGYAYRLVRHERAVRIKDVIAARAYAVTLVKAALKTVDIEASDGYNSQLKARKSLISEIADNLVTRNPAVKALVSDLVTVLTDFLEFDNPVLRIAVKLALSKVINSEGIDKLTSGLLAMLVNDITGEGKASTLEQVTSDISGRLTSLESRWADFAANGGSELEQAGEEWKALDSLPIDLAIVAFLADAAAQPEAWAKDINDTVGALVNGTVSAVTALIRRV